MNKKQKQTNKLINMYIPKVDGNKNKKEKKKKRRDKI